MQAQQLWRHGLAVAAITLLMGASSIPAYAKTWYLGDGTITVKYGGSEGSYLVTQSDTTDEPDSDPVISNRDSATSTKNVLIINSGDSADNKIKVTFKDINIDTSSKSTEPAAVTVTGKGETTIELDGSNTVKSPYDHAGIEKNGTDGSLVIQDENGTAGELTAVGGNALGGGYHGAGIGGGYQSSGCNITITGGTVTATGGGGAAGIGGGQYGKGDNITITGGTVTATGYGNGAGIGGGEYADGTNITIEGGVVVAEVKLVKPTGNANGAAIGGGAHGNGSDITISGGTVTATSQRNGAAIGGGTKSSAGVGGNGTNITISGGKVNATSGQNGAAIGGGSTGNGDNIKITWGYVTATSGQNGAAIGGGSGSTKYGGGDGTNIVITGGAVTATSTNGNVIGAGSGGENASVTISDRAAIVANNDKKRYIGTSSKELSEDDGVTTADIYYKTKNKSQYTHSSANTGDLIESEVLHEGYELTSETYYTGTTFDNGILTLGEEARYKPASDPTDSTNDDADHKKAHCNHVNEWEVYQQATATTDGIMRYRCKYCGKVEYEVPVAAYYVFNKDTQQLIQNAAPNATVTTKTPIFISFHEMIKDALVARPDVTLIVDYRYDGKDYEMTIPAGSSETIEILFGDDLFAGFRYLGGAFTTVEQ